MSTPVDLAPIHLRLYNASPGPWALDPDDPSTVEAVDRPNLALCALSSRPSLEEKANAALIAHAPADLAALVAEVERLREENDLLREFGRIQHERVVGLEGHIDLLLALDEAGTCAGCNAELLDDGSCAVCEVAAEDAVPLTVYADGSDR
ncbi:hypothetical protein [Blastococcus mobilis]|uniref:Uncharacterized protein n=1 Tax=Blastococcus mobilis TaxID=1938746 RepID=A0A238VZL3_9ACTN|nr:hypothetical protein [Blastococcus mobilis]SNR38899.1 hypothetical protein SAMN06272737_105134 [Blastococcus mobilis]